MLTNMKYNRFYTQRICGNLCQSRFTGRAAEVNLWTEMATESLKSSSLVLGIHKQCIRRSPLQARISKISTQFMGEPLFLVSFSSIVDANIRIQQIGGQIAAACLHLGASKHRNFYHKIQTAPTKSILSKSDVCVSATAGPGQTFPSQNGGGEKALPVQPDPSVEPGEIVLAQLKALREKDLATVYEFASPANRKYTGPLPRFTQMLEGRAYNMMIGHVDAQVLSSMTVSNNRFQQRIVITGANGKQATFSWALSKQEEGPYEGCWMTDTVRRDD